MSEIASAWVSLLPSARGFGSKLTSSISGDVNAAGKSSGLSFGKIFAAAAGLGIGKKAFSFLGDSLGEAREAAVVGARTENVIKKMGDSANVTADQVAGLAASLSTKAGVDDELIQSGQNLLLTFGNIRNEAGAGNKVFDRTSALMVDMSVAMGQSTKSSALQLGKALNDPIKGVVALTRAGVSFTEGQKEQIKTLVESGNILGAQKVILGEVGKQFGGAAAAMTTPAEKAKVAWGNLKEQIGTAALPVFNSVSTTFTTSVIPALSEMVSKLGELGPHLGTIGPLAGIVAGGFATYAIAAKVAAVASAIYAAGTVGATGATWSLSAALRANPIGLVVTALTALAGGVFLAYKRSETFRNIVTQVGGALRATGATVVRFAGDAINAGAAFLNKVSPPVKAFASFVGGGLVSGLTRGANFIASTGAGAIAAGQKFVDAARAAGAFKDKVVAKFGEAAAFVKEIPGKVVGFFAGLPGDMLRIGSNVVDGLRNGIVNAWGRVTAAIDALVARIPKRIRDLLGIASPSKVTTLIGAQVGDGLALGLTRSGSKVEKAAEALADKIKKKLDVKRGKLSELLGEWRSIKDAVAGAFTGDLFAAESRADFTQNLLGKREEVRQLSAAFRTLVGWGVNPQFLTGLFSSGNGGLILEMAAGSRADALSDAAIFADIQNLSGSLGAGVAQNQLGDNIKDVRDEIKELRKDLRETAKRIGEVVGDKINGAANRGRERARK